MHTDNTRNNIGYNKSSEEESDQLRRGPWTLEEDTLLIQYIARNGEGQWNLLANRAGLKRTGKSCRLRWLNYLKPDIKRGNLTPQEQLLILELHSKLGNRWSKIAQHLPGRTDNEIKNYWRTRVQKQARQLNIESNSEGFVDAVRCFWMPTLLHKVEQASSSSPSSSSSSCSSSSSSSSKSHYCNPITSLPTISNTLNHQNLGPPDSIIISPNNSVPVSVHPKGCPNSFRNYNFLSQEHQSDISQACGFDKAHQVTCDDVPIDYYIESSSVNYVDMKSSEYGNEGLNLNPIFSELEADFDISGLDGHSLWNIGDI